MPTARKNLIFNTDNSFGLLSILIHWLMAITIFGLFALGLWMVELDYYDAWYKKAPDLHRGVGVLVLLVFFARLLLRFLNPPPRQLASLSALERVAALLMHWSFYLVVTLITLSGYLISTADGRSLDVFDWFWIPAFTTGIENQEDLAGDIHFYLACVVIALASLHTAAALKHHFIDKDTTLRRILGFD